ncbi:MAG: trehalose-phosphatase, partial [bacterium]
RVIQKDNTPAPRPLERDIVISLVRNALAGKRAVCVLLDCDGTLAPIAPAPGLAVIAPGMKEVLRKLPDLPPVRLAVVTGRTRGDVEALIGVPGVVIVGNHGFDAGGEAPRRVERLRAGVRRFETRLGGVLAGFRGALIENKGVALAVHYRCVAPSDAPRLMGEFFDWWLAEGDDRLFRVTPGRKVFEIRPRGEADKGAAVVRLLEEWHGPRWGDAALVFYIGDDATDEDAFRALNDRAPGVSVTVRVGPSRRTRAVYTLPDVAAVGVTLENIYRAVHEFPSCRYNNFS